MANKNKTKAQQTIADRQIHVSPRKLARSVAHAQFKSMGYDNVDKPYQYKGYIAPSYFSTHWKKNISKFIKTLDQYKLMSVVQQKMKSNG